MIIAKHKNYKLLENYKKKNGLDFDDHSNYKDLIKQIIDKVVIRRY